MSTLDPDSPEGATASARTRGTGQVAAGRFVLVVGGLGGTIVRLVPVGPTGESGDLATSRGKSASRPLWINDPDSRKTEVTGSLGLAFTGRVAAREFFLWK
jgi:hypothetical protein